MTVEWIEVHFPGTRDVYIDDRIAGPTNIPLTTREGAQKIDLGPESGYTPLSRRVPVTNTAFDDPKIVTFLAK